MTGHIPGVSGGADNSNPRVGTLLDGLRQRVRQVALFKVAACRDVDNANLVFVRMSEHPLEPALDLIFADAPRAANLHQHEAGLRGYAAIKTAGECAASGGDYRSHHAVPTGDVGSFQRSRIAGARKDALVSANAIARLRQIGMTIES